MSVPLGPEDLYSRGVWDRGEAGLPSHVVIGTGAGRASSCGTGSGAGLVPVSVFVLWIGLDLYI